MILAKILRVSPDVLAGFKKSRLRLCFVAQPVVAHTTRLFEPMRSWSLGLLITAILIGSVLVVTFVNNSMSWLSLIHLGRLGACFGMTALRPARDV